MRLSPEQVAAEQQKTRLRKLWQGWRFRNGIYKQDNHPMWPVVLEGNTFVCKDGCVFCGDLMVENEAGPV